MFNKRVYDRFVKESSDDWIELWRTFEGKKKTCGNGDVIIRNIASLFDFYKEEIGSEFKDTLEDSVYSSRVKVRDDGKLQIDNSTMKGLFARSIESTLAHVKSKLEDGNAVGINTVLMVGGFSDAAVLQEAFKQEFDGHINIVIPKDATSSVLRGAVIYGPQREKTCLRGFANNTGADQPAHPRSLISAFVIRFLESIICKLATGDISTF